MSASQLVPVHPGRQEHEYSPAPSMQTPLTHGWDSHSSMLMSQKAPVQPSSHSHMGLPSELTQAPWLHSKPSQGSPPIGGRACAAVASRRKRANINRRETVVLQLIIGSPFQLSWIRTRPGSGLGSNLWSDA